MNLKKNLSSLRICGCIDIEIPDDRNLPTYIANDLSIVNTIAGAEEDGMLDSLSDNMVKYLMEATIELENYQKNLSLPEGQIQSCIDYAKLTVEDLPRIPLYKEDFQIELEDTCKHLRMANEFEWNEENISKLLKLNEVLTRLMAKARKQQKAIKCDINKLLASGKKYYKECTVNTYIYYNYSIDEEKTIGGEYCNNMNEQLKILCTDFFPEDLDEQNWNIKSFRHAALKGQNICYVMHIIFDHACLPLRYGLLLQPERFNIQSEINL